MFFAARESADCPSVLCAFTSDKGNKAFTLSSWLAFAFLALFMYGSSMLLFFKALAHLDVTTASISMYLVPVFGVLLAITMLGERLNLLEILGAVIVLSATVLIVRYDKA